LNISREGDSTTSLGSLFQCSVNALAYIRTTGMKACVERKGVSLVVLGLCGKVLVAGGATGVASVRRCQNLPPCPIEPVPAGSKTDPPLQDEPISNSGSASGIRYLSRGKTTLHNSICSRIEE